MPGSRVARMWIFLGLLVSLSSSLLAPSLFAQGARVNPSGPIDQDSDRDRPAERDKWFMQGRVAPKGKTAAEMRWKAYQQKIQMRAAAMVAARQAAARGTGANAVGAPQAAGWTALGPAPLKSDPGTGQDYGSVSGRATSVLVDPADISGNTVYLGGAYGGLWRTTNGAAATASSVTWTPMIDGQPTLAVGAIAIQPGNKTGTLSNVILAGTGEANSSADSYYGLGILRSADHGQNWTLITQDTLGKPFHGMAFSKIAFSTANTNLVVAATASSAPGVLEGGRTIDNRGVYVSSNAGASWTYELSVTDGGAPISPLSNSVTSVVYNPTDGKFYAAFRYHGFYSSTDGASWTRLPIQPGSGLTLANCPSVLGATNTCPFYRGEIAVVPGRNEMYFWYVDPSDVDQGIWQSKNSGTTWTSINVNGITNCGDAFGGCDTAQGGYDLELTAIPNPVSAGATDLYAGARNVYKCTITTASPTCSGSVPNTMMNLTHVYGCIGIQTTVHPDQHGLDFIVSGGGQAVMYFAHDGGINRSLNGFALTNSGTCTTPFDDLNTTLGSMTEFVSFSQDPANSAVLLGGTQDNGSPSTSQTNTNWHSVLGGDGGYNQIDPAIPNNWYAARTDVSINLCTKGSACLEGVGGDFTPIVDNTTLGGDAGSFYTPYILDPQNTASKSTILVGTCRIWRGSTAAGYTQISQDFFGNSAVCPVNSDFVHAFAAGGPKDTNGFSPVIYAGLEGTGPFVQNPQGGGLFVTTTSGASPWPNRTPSQNPFYTIGDIAIDTTDATGNTAYVGLQGFNTTQFPSAHVLLTTNAGTSWTDISGNLPNAPVNSLVVDPDPTLHKVYVGTDVGVFSSVAGTSTWAEVGPAPTPGGSGYIPDAPVTRLRLFNNAGNKKLRASTYGRGIWEFVLVSATPDYVVAVPTTTLTTYPNTSISYAGTVTALNGYASTVNLSCGAGAPSSCTPAPLSFVPAISPGTTISVATNSATAADFNFTLHGTDGTLVHDTPLILHVIDFAIGPPSINPVTANVPNASKATNFVVSATGPSFADTVTLTCSGLPAGATCNFLPSANVQPTAAAPVTVTLTIGTTAGTTKANTYPIVITAHDATHIEPAAKAQNLTLIVTALPDYTLAISNSPLTTTILGNPTVAFSGTLTAFNGYTGTVTLTCGAGAPATCTPPAPILPTVGGVGFTVPVSSTTVGAFNFNIHGTDGTIKHDGPVTLNVNADFHVPATVTTCTAVTAGGVSTCSIMIGPDPAPMFANAVTYSCAAAGFPNLSSCSFNPASIAAGMPATAVTVSIRTTAAVASLRPTSPFNPSGPLFAFWLSLPALGIVSLGRQKLGGLKRKERGWAMLGGLVLLMALVGSLAACGGGGSSHQPQPGTTKGTYTFNVDATSNGITHSAPMTLTVN